MSKFNATGLTIDELSPYGYVPSEAVAIVFIAFFGLSTAIHFGQALYYRLWFLLPTAVLCGVGEVAGWSGRLWSSLNVLNQNGYLMQITTTIISPTPLVAGNFILLGRIINLLGVRYSRLNAKAYTYVFLTCDIIALVVQGTGGGLASTADTEAGGVLGGNIVLGGIVFQLVTIICYTALAAEFLWRYIVDRPYRRDEMYQGRLRTTRRMKLLLLGMAIMTVLLFIRSIYRTVELSAGWNGPVIHTQWLFDIFDGLMVVLAMYTLNVLHPGWLLLPEEKAAEWEKTVGPAGLTASNSVSPSKNEVDVHVSSIPPSA